MPNNNTFAKFKLKILIIGITILLIFLFFAIKLLTISLKKYINNNDLDNLKYKSRANIKDRNGILIAVNLPTLHLYANPQNINNPKQIAKKICNIFPDLNINKVINKLKSKKKFVYLKHNILPIHKNKIKKIKNIYFEQTEKRVYPQGLTFSHILGATNLYNNGIAGAELFFDNRLKNNTADLYLSVDLRLQYIVRQALSEGINKYNADAGIGIIVDIHSGEILSLVSLPDYNPEQFSTTNKKQKFNRATVGLYEFGSVFKIFNAAMALANNIVDVNDKIDITKPIYIGNTKITDKKISKKPVSFTDVIVKSSNIGSAKVALQAGSEKQIQFLNKIGLFDRLNIEIPEITQPLYSKQQWGKVKTATISYGYGMAISILNLTNGFIPILNGGIKKDLTLLKKDLIYRSDNVISEEVSNKIIQIMHKVVTDGSGQNAIIPNYKIAGKTGTAHQYDIKLKKYNTAKTINTFVAAFPYPKPKYMLITSLDNPKITKNSININAANNVVKISKQIITNMFGIYNINN